MSFIDWIYPPKCMACKQILPIQEKEQQRFRLCERCHALFERIKPAFCGRCGIPLEGDEALAGSGSGDVAGGFSGSFADGAVNGFSDGVANGFSESFAGGAASGFSGSFINGCSSCRGRTYAFERNLSFFPYDSVLRDIMLDIKFHNRKQSAIGLGELWASVLTPADFIDTSFSVKDSILAPVPMYPRKARSRGFNQAQVLAAAVAKAAGAEMKSDLLKRIVNTPPQSGLTPRGREENVRGVFELNRRYSIIGTKIILVDDIFTTGASLNACAETLIHNGAAKVVCMTLSIAVKKRNNLP